MNYNIILNKGRLQAVNMPKKPALCFKHKDKCEFEDTDWGECLCEKYYREYDQNLAKAKSEAIDFRPEDYRILDFISIRCGNKWVWLKEKEDEIYPRPEGFRIEIVDHYEGTVNNVRQYSKYARLVPIKEQKNFVIHNPDTSNIICPFCGATDFENL